MTSHAADCTYCHGLRSITGGMAGCQAQLCHPSGGSDLPGGTSDAGWASFPSTSHVEGTYTVDFEGRGRGWNWYDQYVGGSTNGVLAPRATTDICDRCHSTAAVVGGKPGTQWAKDGWAGATRLDCATCHNTAVPGTTTPVSGGNSVPIVNPAGPTFGSHLTVKTGKTLNASTNWLTQCATCHAGHVGTAGGVDIPLPPTSYTDGTGTTGLNLRTVLGIDYEDHKGIHLGGTATSGATEAEICWNCHYDDTAGVATNFAEFGVNNDATAGSMVYNYGTPDTWDVTDKGSWWKVEGTTTATWRTAQTANPNFSYTNEELRSMHAANLQNPEQEGRKRPTSTLRCSYCHDVHNLDRATRTTSEGTHEDTDGTNGPPYLRGTCKGSP